jgi:ribose transport system substrate-binding protein
MSGSQAFARRPAPHRRALGLVSCGVVAIVLAGCSATGTTPTATASVVTPIAGRPIPTSQAPSGHIKIAIIGYSNNPFFVNVKAGSDAANAVLASHNASVDWIDAGTNIDVPTVNTAVQSAGAQGYSGIGFFIAGEGNCPLIKSLSAQKIQMGVYNSSLPCVAESGGVIDYAQASRDAGLNSAKELLKALNGKAGKVGIITNLFSSPSNEQRRLGFIEGLKGSNVTTVSDGVQAHDSASETSTAAESYMQSTPDLVGIYCTAGGPFGAAQAVKTAGKSKDVKVIGYDITAQNIAALKDGSLYGVTGQDAFGQAYNVAITLFNAAVTGEKPATVNVAADAPFVTLANLPDHDPSTQPLGAAGTS